jgi:hypothetical protein
LKASAVTLKARTAAAEYECWLGLMTATASAPDTSEDDIKEIMRRKIILDLYEEASLFTLTLAWSVTLQLSDIE